MASTTLCLVSLIVNNERARWSVRKWEEEETPKTYKAVTGKGKRIRCIKSQMLTPASNVRNDGLSMFEAHAYCLEADVEKSKELVWDYLKARIESIYHNVWACNNRAAVVAPSTGVDVCEGDM